MKFLVTGAAGLVGSQVVKDLVEQKQTVFSCFHDEKPTNGNLVYLDLSDENNIIKTLQEIKPDVIIHSAAESHVDNSIKSPSKKVKFFIPDETKYCVKGQPIPPSPTIVILALFNFCIFSSLKFCKINCLENISYSRSE